MQKVLSLIPKTDIQVLELQNHKSLSKDPGVFPYILHNRLTEAAIHAISKTRTVSFDPNVARRHFNLPKGINKQYYSMTVVNDLLAEKTNHHKGSAMTENAEADIDEQYAMPGGDELVHSILCKNDSVLAGHEKLHSFRASEQFIDYYNEKQRKDCLSDSLLQALAFLELEIRR